jgi:hypothetical protein
MTGVFVSSLDIDDTSVLGVGASDEPVGGSTDFAAVASAWATSLSARLMLDLVRPCTAVLAAS